MFETQVAQQVNLGEGGGRGEGRYLNCTLDSAPRGALGGSSGQGLFGVLPLDARGGGVFQAHVVNRCSRCSP